MTLSSRALLARLGVQFAHASGQYVLDMAEHETRLVDIPPELSHSVMEEVYQALAAAMDAGLLSAETYRQRDGQARLVVQATSIVGVVSLTMPDRTRMFVRVRPKVGTARMLELAVLAGMLPSWTGGVHVSESVEDALLEWTIGAFDDALRALLARGGLRNTHERVRATLVNRVNGRLLVVPWLRNVSFGRPHLVPCEFPSLEFDNLVNRFLRWAIHVGIAAARTITGSSGLAERLEKRDHQFAGATLARPHSPFPDPHALPANLRHYSQAIALARLVLDSVRIGAHAGRIEGSSVSLDMNKVYERAFCNCIQAIHRGASAQNEWSVQLRRHSHGDESTEVSKTMTMIPDIWIPGDQGRLPIVIDTKWKKLFRKEGSADLRGPSPDLLQVRPEDLYQATAYALETLHRRGGEGNEETEGCVTVLVYPTTNPVPDLGREIRIGHAKILIRIVAWNVTVPVRNEVDQLWSRLVALAARN